MDTGLQLEGKCYLFLYKNISPIHQKMIISNAVIWFRRCTVS